MNFQALLDGTQDWANNVPTPNAGDAVHISSSPWDLDQAWPRVSKTVKDNAVPPVDHKINFANLDAAQIDQLINATLEPLAAVPYPGMYYCAVLRNCKVFALKLVGHLKQLMSVDNRLFAEINRHPIFKNSQTQRADKAFKANAFYCCIWDLMVGGFDISPPTDKFNCIDKKRKQLRWAAGYDHNATVLTPFCEAVARWIDLDGCYALALRDGKTWLFKNLFHFIKHCKQLASTKGLWSIGGLKRAEVNGTLEREMTEGLFFEHALFCEGISPGFLYHANCSTGNHITFREDVKLGRLTHHSATVRAIDFGTAAVVPAVVPAAVPPGGAPPGGDPDDGDGDL